MDMSQYHELFISEAREHLQKIAELAVRLEVAPDDAEIIASLFRSAHSVKGMAASMGFTGIATLAHKMEDLMDRVRHGLTVDTELFDLLLGGEECLSAMLDQVAGGGSEIAADEIIARIEAYRVAPESEPAVEEKITLQPVVTAPAAADTDRTPSGNGGQQTVKVKTTVLDSFLDTTGELITVKHRLAEFSRSLRNQGLSETVDALEKQLRVLHDQVMAVRLIPLAVVTERFPRMIRDLARKSGKEITFAMKGVEIELDRSILELLGDPLAHLLRNCVDHGIETPAERTAAGKAVSGRIAIAVTRLKDQVEIQVTDDGRGVDAERITAAAVQKGFISREKAAGLQLDEKLLLICHAGFSTAVRVSEVSGRGVGMDVVRTTIHALGGTLAVSSVKGQGVTFLLRLPLTIAIVNVLLVEVGRFTLAIPLTAVTRTLDLKREDIAVIENQQVFFLHDEPVPLLQLGRLLNLPAAPASAETTPLFVTEVKGRSVALQVDRLIGHREVFVKPLGRPLTAIDGLSGATLLGDGAVVFILDIHRLL